MSVLLLLLKYWQYAALASLLAFGAFEWHEHNTAEQAKGRADERARVADSTLKAVHQQEARVDTVYRRDTVTLTRTVRQTLALRDTVLQHIHDTALVIRYVAQTDSTLHVCTETASTCAVKLGLKDQEIAALNAKLAALPSVLPVRH